MTCGKRRWFEGSRSLSEIRSRLGAGLGALLFALSLAGLFPSLTLPFTFGWKTLSIFDLAFALCVLWAAWARPFRPADPRLIAAGICFCAAGFIGWLLHPSGAGLRSVTIVTYSVLVFLFAAHLRLEIERVRLLLVWPLGIALVVAWVLFGLQNVLGIAMQHNISFALPDSVRRLGGLAGGPALVLFLAMATPFVRGRTSGLLLLVSGYATLSRAMGGLAVATLLSMNAPVQKKRRHRALMAMAVIMIGMSLVAYWFALIPADPAQRAWALPTLEPGAYRVLHTVLLRVVALNPLSGVGPGRFMTEFQNHSSREEQLLIGGPERLAYWDPHSAILGLAVEQGLAGVLAFLWLAYEVYRRLRAGSDPDYRVCAFAAVAGLLIGGLVVDWFPLKGLWLWLGFLVAASRNDAERAGLAQAEFLERSATAEPPMAQGQASREQSRFLRSLVCHFGRSTGAARSPRQRAQPGLGPARSLPEGGWGAEHFAAPQLRNGLETRPTPHQR